MRTDSAAAGLGRRAAAFGVDYLLIAAWLAVVVAVGAILRLLVPELAAALFADPLVGEAVGFALITLPVGLYFAVSEAGSAGATWGKRRMGMRVLTADAERLTLGRSALRTVLKLVPWELAHAVIWRYATPGSAPEGVLNGALIVVWLLVGANLASALVDPDRRTLYDRLARTQVVAA